MSVQNDGKLLQGQDYIKDLDLVIPYTQQEVRDPEIGDPRQDITPQTIHQSLVRDFELTDEAIAALNSYHLVMASSQDIQLPNRLTSWGIIWDVDESEGTSTVDPTSLSTTGGPILKGSGSVNASATVAGQCQYEMTSGYRGPIDSELHIFFMLFDDITSDNVLARVNEVGDGTVTQWPIFKPTGGHVIDIFGGHQAVRQDASVSVSNPFTGGGPFTNLDSVGTSKAGGISCRTDRIPECIHTTLTPSITGSATATADATLTVITDVLTATATVTGSFTPATLDATSPTVTPTGRFLYSFEPTPYQVGYARVTCVVVNLTSDYV